MSQLMATCARKHQAKMKMSVRYHLKQVTPSHLLQVSDGYTESGIGLDGKL